MALHCGELPRKAYKKGDAPPDDNERRVKQRRKSHAPRAARFPFVIVTGKRDYPAEPWYHMDRYEPAWLVATPPVTNMDGNERPTAAFPDRRHVRCWRSLHGPRHRPSGTGLSSAIMAAPLVAAPSTCAPGHLAAQHARAMRRRTLDCGSDCAPMGHRHSASHRGRTHGYVVSAASEFQAAPPARAYTGRPEVHGPMRLVDDGGPTATCCHAGRACRARR